MSPLLAAVGLSVASAVGYAAAAVTQEHLAAQPVRPSGLFGPLRSPRWWSSVGLNASGAVLHAVALRYGSLAIVQPFGALTLVLALPMGAAFGDRRVTGREWRGALATVVGLTGLVLVTDTGAPTRGLDDAGIVALAAGTAGVIGLLARAGRTGRGLRLATASGVAFGVASVLTQTLLLRFMGSSGSTGSTDGSRAWMGAATAAAVGLFSGLGLLLSQAAYRDGLGAPLATLTIANPVTAGVIGTTLLGQSVALTLGGALVAGLAAVLTARGVVLLAAPAEVSAPAHCARRRAGRPRRRNRRRGRRAGGSRRTAPPVGRA